MRVGTQASEPLIKNSARAIFHIYVLKRLSFSLAEGGLHTKQGLYSVLAAIAIQLTLGIAYIWSVFQTGIAESIFGGDNGAAALSFSLLLATLGFGGIAGGKLAIRYSIRFAVFTGGIILSLGFFIASLVTAETSWLLWISYGIMGGVGMGFTYSTTIACAQKWYPHKKGLVTGVIVSALGLGGVVFTPIIEALIKALGEGQAAGAGEMRTFMVLSGLFLAVCSVGCLFTKNPTEEQTAASNAAAAKAARDYSTAEMLKTPQFYLVTLTFALACMGGLMMIGFAKPIAVAKGLAESAVVGVLAISVFNSLGRLVWGMVSDRLGQKNTLIILLCGTAIFSLFVNAAEGYWIYVLIACIGFFYGGFLSNFPSLTAALFGSKYTATNYGCVLFGFGIGAIASSQIAGHYKNIAADDIGLMFPAFVIASCCALAGVVMMFILKALTKREP